ncbi:Glutathione S-transferase, theta [Klebsiella pneumoniae IS33]|nr:Glutathione S-transferase, theta [Klebsiella pneumoniae IS33]
MILLEKRIPFEFVNESPYSESNGVARYNPLGKVPALVTDDGECWFDSPVIAQYLELLGVAPPMIPADPRAALRMRQLEALADGVMEAAQALVREKARPAAQQSEQELLRQREKVARGLDRLEACAADGTLRGDEVNLATISTACAIAYLTSPGGAGLVRHPAAVGEVGGCAVPARQLCAHRTAADLTQAGNSLRKEALQSPLIVDSLSRREGGK